MKYLYPFLLFAVLSAAAFATETSDKFAQYLPNFAAEDGKVRESAQQDWQKAVLGEPANRAEAVKLMLDQLAKDNPVETSLWLLRQTGYSAGSEAVPTLVKYLGNSEKRLADEAARALGRIPTAEASAALKAADTKLTNDVIIERNHDRNILNKNSKETALPQALFAADGKTVADWMKKYDSLSDYEKS
ncbi:MAG: hypothetical protein LBN39_06680, partial [Planctomycetaceae bacterium]|nr:hypothetical protein [Planctomycetaceae bacterium]